MIVFYSLDSKKELGKETRSENCVIIACASYFNNAQENI